MTIDKLKRVMQRVRYDQSKKGNPAPEKITRADMRRAVIIEAGFSRATYYNVTNALVAVGWIRRRTTQIFLTGKDLTEDV